MPRAVELLHQPAELAVLELERCDQLVQLAEIDAAALLPAVDQRGERACGRIGARLLTNLHVQVIVTAARTG